MTWQQPTKEKEKQTDMYSVKSKKRAQELLLLSASVFFMNKTYIFIIFEKIKYKRANSQFVFPSFIITVRLPYRSVSLIFYLCFKILKSISHIESVLTLAHSFDVSGLALSFLSACAYLQNKKF